MSLLLDLLYPRDYHQSDFNKIKIKSVRHSLGLEGALSLFKYHYPIKDLLHEIKYNFVTDIIPEIVKLSVDCLKSDFPNILKYWQQEKYYLIPVPLHPYRQNWRGFNQSELICHHLSESLGIPCLTNIVTRHRSTKSQVTLDDKTRRQSNLANSFSLVSSPPPNIILFDDVITTGSTISSLASIFPENSSIWALSIAG